MGILIALENPVFGAQYVILLGTHYAIAGKKPGFPIVSCCNDF